MLMPGDLVMRVTVRPALWRVRVVAWVAAFLGVLVSLDAEWEMDK